MNFFDAYDISGTATAPAAAQPTQSLNEEVSEVVGQLSRFWGGFRKQSQTAFEAAKKDLGTVVQQAQKELTKLTAEAPSTPPEPSASATEQAASVPADAADAVSTSSSASSTSTETTDKAAPESSPSQPAQPQTIFARLQASLPPALANVQSQLPETLKETLKHARVGSANLTALDFAQLRSTIASELQKVQGATEEYVHRSEDFLREAGEFLKEAVKVVPPEEGDSVYPGLIWDGTDVWMLPTTSGAASPSPAAGSSKGKGKEREASGSSGRPSVDTLRSVATRAESLLKQLRHDPEVIKADPKDDGNVRDVYSNWLASEAASEDRGLGTTAWQNKVERALADPVDGAALKATMDTLVPETLTYDEFWTRYFFRVHQVEREEARRKAIIQGTTDNEDDFSWEDDDEESASPTTKLPATPSAPRLDESPVHLSGSTAETKSRVSTPVNVSPRQSSEDSYDVVSQVSNGGAKEVNTAKSKGAEKSGNADDDDDDDEEDDEDDEDEDEDEDEEGEEEDSDWE
ncbi:hypothetical protein BD309DRAFT_960793 [Dichomitus squalens]|uniref:Uncharacterized protein n=1 Tax=Dichomitus squalens TaxID=114155 RepID=A0A4Q9NV35_9APHY|nr:hypothetical protein BD309DRAFT_960793 [Dichomitus squalens]TBU64542.1 hypothetical protein BD310DRAFT_914828 [Dichomitus squalens]